MKYSGVLATPLNRPQIGVIHTDDQIEAEWRRVLVERLEKLPALAQAHGVAEGDWLGLAMRLAETHVPGFKMVNRAGRRTEWSELDKAELRIDADDIREKTGKTVDASIREAVKSDRWRGKTSEMKPAALRQHYYAADARFIQIAQDARAFEGLPQQVKNALNEGLVEEARELLEAVNQPAPPNDLHKSIVGKV